MTAMEEMDKKGSALKGLAPLLLIFAGFLLFAGLCYLPLFSHLTVTDEGTGATLLHLPMKRGETFSLRFTHSLNLSDVTDTIQWTGRELICRSTLFSTYGAGIPDLPDGIGTTLTQTEGGFLLSGIDKAEPYIDVMLQTVPRHRLLYRGREIDLLKAFGSGTLIRLEVRRLSIRDLLSLSGSSKQFS